jgi:asparagine synthetase B (glutamine-hydrolysing)
MPGLVVAVGKIPLERFRGATRKLQHMPSHACAVEGVASNLLIGACAPASHVQTAASRGGEHPVHVWCYGHIFKDAERPLIVRAEDILRDYLVAGVDACFEYDGSFVIVIADLPKQRVFVVPDRLSTQPLYFARRGDEFVIAPEVKAIAAALQLTPRLSREGVIGFLAAGYNIGSQSVFEGVDRLEAGKLIEIALGHSHALRVRRFWKLAFDRDNPLTNRHDAEDALLEAVKRAHRLLLADRPRFQILLSGGADSRGMLGACKHIGVMADKAVTWGLLRDVPRSDASISRALAESFGVPWDFIVTRTDGFVDNCEQWSYVSELSNDNFGWYAEGFGTLTYLQESCYPASLIGDESWGCQGFAHDEFESVGKVLTPSLDASLLALMRADRREPAIEAYTANIRDALRDCDAVDWNDRKDFLYLHGRVARFIFSLGYNRAHGTEQRRPFLTRAVLDVVRRLPPEYRAFKNLYRSFLRRHMPETMRVPYASVNSLPDWNYDIRAKQSLRDCMLDLLQDTGVSSGVLGEVLDPQRFRALRDAYFATPPTPVARTASAAKVIKGQVKEMLWCSPVYKYVDRWQHARAMRSPTHGLTQRSIVEPVDFLRRVAVIVLLERQLHRLQVIQPQAMAIDTPARQHGTR